MCTRVLWNTNDLAVLTGRTMDWPESTQPLFVGFPRGRERNGIARSGLVDDPNPLRWTSRYSSLVTTIYGVGTVDGLYEAVPAGPGGHGQRGTGADGNVQLLKIHVALEDVGGDSAIIEFADGRPVVHRGRQYTLMTNDPTYDE